MKVADILSKAHALGVRLRLDGEIVKIAGSVKAVAAIKPDIAAHKPEIVLYLRSAANDPVDVCFPVSRDGGAFMPWCAPVAPGQVREWMAELVELIEEIANAENWLPAHLDNVLARAVNGPLSDLLPNLHHFRATVAEIDAECEARHLVHLHTWRAGKDFDNRRA